MAKSKKKSGKGDESDSRSAATSDKGGGRSAKSGKQKPTSGGKKGSDKSKGKPSKKETPKGSKKDSPKSKGRKSPESSVAPGSTVAASQASSMAPQSSVAPRKPAKKTSAKDKRSEGKKKQSRRARVAAKVKQNYVAVIVILVIGFLIIAGLVGGVLYWHYFLRKQTVHVNFQNTTERCRIDEGGTCRYFPHKYVNCSAPTIPCFSVQLIPKLVKIRSELMEGARLVFIQKEVRHIDIVDGTPCAKGKWCVSKVCVESNDAKIRAYDEYEGKDGKWQEESSGTSECFAGLDGEDIDEIKWQKYTAHQSCSTTQKCERPVEIKFRSCTNPYPAYGGKPCWDDSINITDALPFKDWPLTLKDCRCDYASQDFIPRKPCDNFTRDVCMFTTSYGGVNDGQSVTDLRECCSDESNKKGERLPGRCILGTCVPPTN